MWCVFEEGRKQSPDHHCRPKISAMDAALGIQKLILMMKYSISLCGVRGRWSLLVSCQWKACTPTEQRRRHLVVTFLDAETLTKAPKHRGCQGVSPRSHGNGAASPAVHGGL